MRNAIKSPKVPKAVLDDPDALERLALEKIAAFCSDHDLTFTGEKTVTRDGESGIVIQFTTEGPS